MLLLALFLIDLFVFRLVFRVLSAPGAGPATRVRLALGTVVIFFMALVTLWVVCSPWALLATAVAAALASTALQGAGLQHFDEALGRWRFAVYLLSVLTLSALVFLCLPITTFLTSPGEISIHLDYLVTVNARNAMVVVYAAAALYALLAVPRMRTALTLLAVSALAVVMVYSYALPFGYPMMSGLAFEQIPLGRWTLTLRVVLDVLVVVAVVFAVIAAIRRFGGRPVVIALVLVDVSLVVAAGIGVLRDEAGGAGGAQAGEQTLARPLRFSPAGHNVLIIFLDRFMGSYIESILRTDPGLAHRLEGFVWYPRTVSAGENSIAGVHPMLGGYDYTPVEMNARRRPLRDLSVEAFSILPYNFSRKGYRVNVVNPRGLGFTMAGDCRYLAMKGVACSHVPLSVVEQRARQMGFPLADLSKSNYADLLVLLASMRSLPYAGKQVLFEKGPWRPFLDHSAGTTFREWAELTALGDLSMTTAAEPNFNFISNILPHEPYYMGEDCVPRDERLMVQPSEVRRRGHTSLFSLQHSIAARCALMAVAGYMDFLRKTGVYANTRIVVVSDHGIVGPVEDTSTRAVAGGTQGNMYVRTRSVLLVKEARAAGPLRVSEEFMPNAEVPRIVCEDIGGCVNPYLNGRRIAAHGRDDPFQVSLVPWQFNLQRHDAFVIRSQFALKGKDPYDAEGWVGIE